MQKQQITTVLLIIGVEGNQKSPNINFILYICDK